MDWRPYTACCLNAAVEGEIAFCPVCGHPLLRCMAFDECKTLVTPTEPCATCVAPTLLIDKGAVVQSRTGERLSLPLIVLNASPAGRPIWVKRIVRWSDGVAEPIALTWEQLAARTERRVSIDTPPMAVGGTHTLQLILVVASRYKGLEEEYAFAAGMSVSVAGVDTRSVHQSITITGNQIGTGGTVYTPLAHDDAPGGAAPTALQDRTLLTLERAEKYKLEQGIRGYSKDRLRVPRHVTFGFTGFRSSDHPEDGVTATPSGRLSFGRNSLKAEAAHGTVANDVCLRAYDARTGHVDEPATMAISRHHFDMVVVNDRLCIQARATSGMQVNAEALSAGDVFPIMPGDRIVPIPGRPDKVTVHVRFVDSIGSVNRIDIERIPAARD